MITDDARVVDPKACQVETWMRRNQGSTERWALPACNPTGNAEITLGGGLTTEGGETHATDVQLQVKTLFRKLETNDWGIGLAVGRLRHPGIEPRRDLAGDLYGYVPISVSMAGDAVVWHGNVGALRARDESRHRVTWGLGAEIRVNSSLFLIPEVFSQAAGRPSFQAGIRYWVVPGHVQIDTTFGDRLPGGNRSRWFSVGLRLISVPFLP